MSPNEETSVARPAGAPKEERMKVVRFLVIWATPLVTVPLAVLAWLEHGPPPFATGLFLVAICVLSPLLNRTIWRVQ